METEDKNIPKPKQAVAVRYREDKDTAPRIVAKGTGFTAEQIINTAVQHSVPLYQNSTMAGMLMAVELDREIPPELYNRLTLRFAGNINNHSDLIIIQSNNCPYRISRNVFRKFFHKLRIKIAPACLENNR